MQNRLLPLAKRNGLIPDSQFGFQLGVGTADACGVSNHVAESVVQQGGKLFRTFIDLKKAYDKVDRQVLWLILARGGVPPRMVALIQQMHDGSMARVRLGSNLSTPFELQRGLKQGSVFAPLLFNIFFGAVIKACEHRYGGDPTLPPADT